MGSIINISVHINFPILSLTAFLSAYGRQLTDNSRQSDEALLFIWVPLLNGKLTGESADLLLFCTKLTNGYIFVSYSGNIYHDYMNDRPNPHQPKLLTLIAVVRNVFVCCSIESFPEKSRPVVSSYFWPYSLHIKKKSSTIQQRTDIG